MTPCRIAQFNRLSKNHLQRWSEREKEILSALLQDLPLFRGVDAHFAKRWCHAVLLQLIFDRLRHLGFQGGP